MLDLVRRLTVKTKIILLAILLMGLIAIVLCFEWQGNKQSVSVSNHSSTEMQLLSLLGNIEGVGTIDLMITEESGAVTGVVVVCQGADSIRVKNDLLNAVATALQIDKNKIAIYKMTA